MNTPLTTGSTRVTAAACLVYGALATIAAVLVYAAPQTMQAIAYFITGQDILGRALAGGAAGAVSFGCIPVAAGIAMVAGGFGLLGSAGWGRSWALVAAAVIIGNNVAWAIVVGLGLTVSGIDGLLSTTLLLCAVPGGIVAALAAQPPWSTATPRWRHLAAV